ncbi:LPXTG cell wall anchor domain-containing protein [Actinokineospora bangkokensis]|uniref:Gram-positive cocci surface proteins LPxTG domain-containing protein n=1 Tax=Actinokineospora bangkokensis TaxID=1193682 RepID=A0A1Q9LH46_9PSEU|nr:LPXTG cell wall anchor domain-containing protein [Actinokineospora bangkokensis]OLR91335.1 hypothetical protein BJP25_27105 [Actinokineospora bangkokensis]
MSTSRSRFLARAGAVALVATAATIGMTGVASAHTGVLRASCDGESQVSSVSFQLTSYNGRAENTWVLTDNGSEVARGTFAEGAQKSWTDRDATTAHSYELKVVAGDGPKNPDWSFTKKASAEACKTAPPTTTTTTTTITTTVTVPPSETTTPPAETTTTTEAPAPSTTPAAPAPGEDDLADTGASIALPLALGGVLVLGGAGALVAVRRRSAKG